MLRCAVRHTPRGRLAAVAVTFVLVAAGCSSGGGSTGDTSTTASSVAEPAELAAGLELRPLGVVNQRIVDDLGREVLLRGANVNALGEYYQAVPGLDPTAPVTAEDWDAMAAHGFSVVRLIMSWSRLEPTKGTVDEGYLDEVGAAVQAANQRGIYVVLDMHQDAWGMDSATPTDVTCPAGTEASIGWDGAPSWATITDGATTCRPPGGEREQAPAVQAAWANFYENTDGIADELTSVWARVAEEFSSVPGVAGYDLLNEPNTVQPYEQNEVAYSEWISSTITAIRRAEDGAQAAHKPAFVEPLQLYPAPNSFLVPDLIHDDALVFAPHNYAESILDFMTVEQTFELDQGGADKLGAALWIGEYGFWDTDASTLDVVRRYAAQEDARALGGAWWQWRQTCGDPHSVGQPTATGFAPPTADQVHLLTRSCPDDVDAGPTVDFLRVLGRAYPRAAPGHIATLVSDPETGTLDVEGTEATVGTPLVVWLPDVDGDGEPLPVTVTGLSDLALAKVEGGWVVTATTTASAYSLTAG